MESQLELLKLSQELLCNILGFLPISDMLSTGMTCKKLQTSVKIYLQLCKKLDLCDTEVWGSMPTSITDDQLRRLLERCPKLEVLHGLYPQKVESRRLRGKAALSVPGVIDALLLCPCLKKVETNSFDVFEAILLYLPHVQIDGCFRNYLGGFHPDGTKHLKLPQFPLVTSLHLTGIFMHEIGYVPTLEHLQLQWIRFTRFDPFSSFSAPNLKTFVMKHCFGPDLDFGYLSLFDALSHSSELKRLECVKLPIPGGLIQRAVEESWHLKGFQKLEKLVLSKIKTIMTSDMGYLMVAAARNLQSVSLPPEILSDNFFASLQFAKCDFPKLKRLSIAHDEMLWDQLSLIEPDTVWGQMPINRAIKPSSISDRGMKIICNLFPNIEMLNISHSPYLNSFENWSRRHNAWKFLRHLTLRHCYCLNTVSLYNFVKSLEQLEVLILKDMFPKKPRGCSHVGLSAGTGLGLKSVLIQTRDEHVAIFDEPLVHGRDHDARFFNLHNVNNGVECEQHGNHCHNSKVKVKIEDDSLYASSNEAVCGSDTDDEDADPLNTPSTSSGITRKKHRKSSRKKPYEGPLTRHRSRMILPKRYHQSTQTCFSALQFNIVLQQQSFCCSTCRVNCRCYRANNTYDCNDYPLRKQGESGIPPYLDASTSTNDPMYGDDGISQSISLESNTLKSVTMIACGIYTIHMYCSALEHLEVQACGSLSFILFEREAPKLSHVNISHCPKFIFGNGFYSLPHWSNSTPLILYFRPHISFDRSIKSKVEQSFPGIFRYTFAVLYDYSCDDSERGFYRENLLDWLRFTQRLMKALNLHKDPNFSLSKVEYGFHRIHGVFADGARYELITNNGILAAVWRQREDSIEICPNQDYNKETFSELVSSLWESAAEEEQIHFYSNSYRGCYIRLYGHI